MKSSSQTVLTRVFALLFLFILAVSVTVASIANDKCASYEATLDQALEEAEKGVVSSQFIAGKMYFAGQCVDKDYFKARKWLLRAAVKSHVDATRYLARVFYDDKSPYKDYEKAIFWFKRAHSLGDSQALYYLGDAYLHGKGVRKNKRMAQQLLLKAMRHKDPRAHYTMGYIYQKGIGIGRRNYRKAFGWYTKAALMGYKEAHLKLAEFYARGLGVRRDRIKAYTWYSIADLHGHKSGSNGKNKIYKRLNSQHLAEAQGLIQRYMKSMEYSEYQ